jgi:acyl-CoA synthetase (AMP-forming)/AMP-acid ligase II
MSGKLTLIEVLARQVAARPDKAAFVFRDEAISYAALDCRSRRVAAGLLAAGVGPGDRVAYIGANSAAYYEILFGAARIGAVLMPVNWRLADAEMAYILANGRVGVLFAEPAYLDRLAGIALGLKVALDGLGIADAYADWRDGQRDTVVDAAPDPDRVVMQLYTSGTTGRPKGAMLSHHGILALRTDVPEEAQPEWNRWSDGDVSILPLPLFHIGTAAWGLIGLYYGATSVIQPEFEAESFIAAIERYRVTRLCMVPSALKLMIEHECAANADFSSVAYTFYGASPIPPALLRDAMRVVGGGFVQIFGMTETSGAVLGLPPEDHMLEGSRRMLSAGRPYPGVELEIRDPDGRALPDGEIGEVSIRCGATMLGYFGDTEATARTIDGEGWLRTGDAGFLEDGYLFIHDRIKEMIISGGENVYPAEVEAALYEHPAIAEAAVIGVPDAKWGEAVKAVVVLSPDADAEACEAAIISWAKARIAGFKVPKSIDFVSSLPRNPSGKLLRKDLREPYWAGIERRVN